jgi:hypothetical protein
MAKRYIRARSDEISDQINAAVNELSGLEARIAACKANIQALTMELKRLNNPPSAHSPLPGPSAPSDAKLDLKKPRLVICRDIATQTE